MIDRTAIHRCISNKFPAIRDFPRIFIFDACDGSGDRRDSLPNPMVVNSQSIDVDEMETESPTSLDSKKSTDSPKNTTFEDVQEDFEWTTSTKNPDYNLVLIHAANSGFVAKMQESEVGSYLTYFFTKKIQDNIVDHGRRGLAVIMEDIQNLLHDHGKQQIRKEFYNNTMNLRIEVNTTGMRDEDVFG